MFSGQHLPTLQKYCASSIFQKTLQIFQIFKYYRSLMEMNEIKILRFEGYFIFLKLTNCKDYRLESSLYHSPFASLDLHTFPNICLIFRKLEISIRVVSFDVKCHMLERVYLGALVEPCC